jgi:hypothetical protein
MICGFCAAIKAATEWCVVLAANDVPATEQWDVHDFQCACACFAWRFVSVQDFWASEHLNFLRC